MERIRLLLVDDHILFRQSLSRLLASERDFEVVADCGTGDEALEILERSPVDVVLLDFDLGQASGGQLIAGPLIAASRRAGYPARVLMVTAGMTAGESSRAIRLGGSGIFLKHGSPSALAQAIRLIAGGAMWVDPHIIQEMAERVDRQENQTERRALTEREQHVLQGVFEGLANKEIGARLGVSESAVKATLQQLFRKTGVRTRSQLVRIALEGSFVAPAKRP
jgi:two-component system, NarL family, nitrate/nitrite response regulator NarL